jgi:hypothetical protein
MPSARFFRIYSYSSLSSTYALACIDVFKAYGGDPYLQKAVALWARLQAYQVTSFTFRRPPDCNGSQWFHSIHNTKNAKKLCAGTLLGALAQPFVSTFITLI